MIRGVYSLPIKPSFYRNGKIIMKTLSLLLGSTLMILNGLPSAQALPAFALREKVSCNMCHANGSAPHLTEYGYLYRRAGFRLPDNIGNKENDAKAMTFQEHMAAGVSLSYEVLSNTSPGASKATLAANQINVPEVEVWPLVGAFLGNFAVWSEIDAAPGTTGGGSVDLSQADLRYAYGNANSFFNFRGGIIAPEGFGASDQWLDDGNIPLMETNAPFYNQDSLATPFGAMNAPQMGLEFGYNYLSSHLTLGIYNGYSGVTHSSIGTPSATPLTPALTNRTNGTAKDYKVQVDQFVGDIGAVTLAYYTGYLQMMDPTGVFEWPNDYNASRAYFTYFAVPDKIDVLFGFGVANSHFVNSSNLAYTNGSPIGSPDGSFQSRGGFLGLNYYVMPHLTLAVRGDYNRFNNTPEARAQATGQSFQASMPFENNQFIFKFNNSNSDLTTGSVLAGNSKDFRLEWRFLF